MIDPDEFKTISFKFAKNNFVFNGPESLDSLNIHQLDVLRRHKWKRRKAKELAEGEEPDNAQNAKDEKAAIFDVEETKNNESGDNETLYRVTQKHKEVFTGICRDIHGDCSDLFSNDETLCKRAENLLNESKSSQMSEDLVPFMVEFKSRVQSHVIVSADQSSHQWKHALITVEKREAEIRDVLLDQVIDIAFKLRKEGLISVAPLEWDGRCFESYCRIVCQVFLFVFHVTVPC